MKLSVLASLFFMCVSLFAKGAMTVTGVYECEGNVTKREFKLDVKKNGAFEKVTRVYLKDGRVRTDSDVGSDYYGNTKMIGVHIGKRQRVNKKGEVTSSIKDYTATLKVDGNKSIAKLKKGMKLTGTIMRSIEEKMSKEKKDVEMKVTYQIVGQEGMKHPTLGSLTVWNTKQKITYDNKNGTGAVRWETTQKYHPTYGIVEFQEKNYTKDQEDYTENCRLANWK